MKILICEDEEIMLTALGIPFAKARFYPCNSGRREASD